MTLITNREFIIIFTVVIILSLRVFSFIPQITHYFLDTKPNYMNWRRMNRYNLSILMFELLLLEAVIVFSVPSPTNSADDISEQINVVSSNLAEASAELSSIQKALESRIEFVEDLKEQAEIAENVISLSEEQVNAVQAKLARELSANSGRDRLFNIVLNAVFFMLGILFPHAIKRLKQKKNRATNDQLLETKLYTKADVLKILDAAQESIEKAEQSSK